MQRHEPWWAGGEKSLVCDPGSELRLGGRENRRAKIINGMEKKINEKNDQYESLKKKNDFIRVCNSVGYVLRNAGGIFSVNTVPKSSARCGTASIPVYRTLRLGSARPQYWYPTLGYVRYTPTKNVPRVLVYPTEHTFSMPLSTRVPRKVDRKRSVFFLTVRFFTDF